MQTDFQLKKILKIAVITSPLFGLFASMPGFAMRPLELERKIKVFLFITLFTFSFWLINIFFVWISYRVYALRNNLLRFVSSAFICGIIVFIVFLFLRPAMPGEEIMKHRMQGHFHLRMALFPITQSMSINLIVFILLELIILRETKNRIDIENEQLKIANLQAKNTQLKQQLHPHFLFNSLSTLRALIKRSPAKAEDYLEKLSELLRFSTNNNQNACVMLYEETELCTNFLNMQKVRFGDALHFIINIPDELQQKGKVPIFSLQQLAENAIKHNVLTKSQPLTITIDTDISGKWIIIRNNLQPKTVSESSSEVGLTNLSERYKLLGNDDIIIKKEAGYFSVSIKILEHAGPDN